MGLGGDDSGRWGGSRGLRGLVRMDVPPIPSPLPRENEPSIPHFSSLLSSGQTSLPAPAALGNAQLALVSLLSPVHSPRPGGRRRAWLEQQDCSPATTACLGGRQQGRHCPPRCHAASGSCCHSPARAMPGQSSAWCWVGTEGARRCCGGKMGTDARNYPTGTGGSGVLPRAPLAPKGCRTVG